MCFSYWKLARIQVAETNLPDDDPGFPMPGSSIVRQKKYGTVHLVKKEGEEDQWLDSVRLYCGRRSSEATHERVMGPVWPRRLTPRCSDCFYSRLKEVHLGGADHVHPSSRIACPLVMIRTMCMHPPQNKSTSDRHT